MESLAYFGFHLEEARGPEWDHGTCSIGWISFKRAICGYGTGSVPLISFNAVPRGPK
jgi:hypothetical protein